MSLTIKTNNMKKLIFYLMTTCLLLAFNPFLSNAATSDAAPTTLVDPKPVASARAETLLQRLNEINAMDKSDLKSSDRKNLRKEVKSIKSELKNLGDGVYLSVGALIIIVILLIILL